ncbi:bifunctional diguanylate cyclase/phosphodiesterase [Kordiimonas marina]|uniref:bifunctional diguanylate cyclase/phosphodiesterase n=1 Tax=Kordiimonas marina TaxID=2872312 RepID=UPI001FF1DD17|nr:EAL domain-containing protein [Kordiimonas marina]
MIAHESRLLILAVFVCLFASYTAVTLAQRISYASEFGRRRWLFLTALATGIGVWATHFIAMLAYTPGVPVSYAFLPTVGSLLVAVIMAGLAFFIDTRGKKVSILLLAAGTLGLGIGAMHHLGMAGMRVEGRLNHDHILTVLGVVFGVAGSVAMFRLIRRGTSFGRQAQAAGALAFAICGLHFTSMCAITVTPDPTIAVEHGFLSEQFLAFGVTLATLTILSFSLAGAILDRHMAERRLMEAQRLRGLANAALEGIVLLDENGAIVDANHSFLGLSGRRLATLQGMPFSVCFQNLNFGSGIRTAGYVGDAILVGAGGQEIATEVFFRPVQDRTQAKHVAIVRDIRERRAAEQQIDFLSNHDTVTGLANRAALTDRLEHSLMLARKGGRKVALYFIDIDTFKDINAQFGQRGGDELLKALATRLTATASDVDTVARLSADQFCILQENIENTEAADFLALRIRRALVQPFIVGEQMVTVTASTGIAIFPGDADSAEDLLLRAEVAVKRAKTEGRGRYCFFEHEIDRKLEERRALKQDLMGALGRHELFLVYQPQFRTADSRLTGFEVLLRWKHPERGMISPAEFIPLAEETGVINDISLWILNEACREAASWGEPLGVAINLSPVQFLEDGLVDLVDRITKRHGLHPERLELEVTEGVLIADEAGALEVLNALKALGIRLAMDDFGTGYSSLSYLQNFPFDKLKIDRAFVMQMEERPQSAAIVRGMIGLGHGIGVPVLAEGVETEAQLAMLREEGCDEVQGFLLGRPERIEVWADVVSPGGQRKEQGA